MAVPYTQPCTFKSVTLQPGESYILPAGAQIVSATDSESITSDCADLSQIEQLDCYGFILVARVDTTSASKPYDTDDDDIEYTGVYLNNIYYPFQSPNSVFYLTSGTSTPSDCFSTLPFGSSITNICTSFIDSGNPQDSRKVYIIFNTTPSIASTLELRAATQAANSGSGIPYVEYRIPCLLRSTIISDGHENVCDCPTT